MCMCFKITYADTVCLSEILISYEWDSLESCRDFQDACLLFLSPAADGRLFPLMSRRSAQADAELLWPLCRCDVVFPDLAALACEMHSH